MGITTKKQKLSTFSSESSLRTDFKYINSISNQAKSYYSYKELFDFVAYNSTNIHDLDDFLYAEIGDVSKNGEVVPTKLSFLNREEEHEHLFKKIEKGDIIKPQNGDILISKIRPYLNKNVLIGNENSYYTKAFIHIRPKINATIFYFALRTIFNHQINAVSRQGKGYPTLKEDDLKAIRFPKHIIDHFVDNETAILAKISALRAEIEDLNSSKISHLEIINQVFDEEIKFDWQRCTTYLNKKFHCARFTDLANDELKFDISLKYRKAFEFAKENSPIKWITLSEIVEIKGGKRLEKGETVSEEESDYKYIRVDDLSWSGAFDIENIKYISAESHLKIKNYIACENDILLTIVGATVGKCGLVPPELSGENITENFARLILKNDTNNPHFILYCLMSKISQFQFSEYTGKSSQGKLALFRIKKVQIPNTALETQAEIVAKIQLKLDAQAAIEREIEAKQTEINTSILNF